MTNATKALGQNVHEKATHELVGVQRHRLGLVLGAIILPAKADAPVLAVEKTAVGDGDTMGVATEIIEDLCGTGERRFGEHDPVDIRAAVRDSLRTRLGQRVGEIAEETQLAGVERRLQTFEEQTADKGAREHGRAGRSWAGIRPSASVGCEATSRHDAMNMRMMVRVCPQVCRIAIIPISAPRCLGSAAMSRIVSAAALNRMS